MENGDEERHSQTNGDARLDNDCGKQEDASTSSVDSGRELGARCKTKCIPYNIPSVSSSGKLNNADCTRKVRRRRALDFEKVHKSNRFGNSVHEEDVSESDEDETNGPAGQRNGDVNSVEGEQFMDISEKPDCSILDSYIRNNVAGFEPNPNKCPDKKEDSDSKLNLSSDSDNDGDIEEEDEEDDGLSADECCIYTYRGDREGVADLPFLLGVDGQDAENAANVDAMGNIGRRLGEAAPRCSSPEMDFLEMDFDPGPPTGRDSDESGRGSPDECDGADGICVAMNPEVSTKKLMDLEVNDSLQKNCQNEELCHSVGHHSPPSTMSPSPPPPPPVSHQPSNNLSLPNVEKGEVQEDNLMVNLPSEGVIPGHNTKANLPPAAADSSKGAVPKIMPLNLVMEPRAPSNTLCADASFEGCRRRQCLDVIRQEMDRSTRGLIFAGINGCESSGLGDYGDAIHQTNLLDSSVNSPSYYVPVYICLPMQKHSPNKSQPKLLQIQTNSNLANCRGHRKGHGDHVPSSSSDRGAAEVIVNALSALDVPVPYAKVQQGICMAMPSGYSGKSAPPNGLVEYLEWRASCKGAPSQIEIVKAIEWASEGAVVSRFFPASSNPSESHVSAQCCSSSSSCPESSSISNKAQVAGVNLMDWLYYWMKRGAVPIVTLNSQDWIDCIKSSGVENPDHSRMCGFSERSGATSNFYRGGMEEGERWVHQMVIGLGPRGAYLSGCANEQCCAEVRSLACLLVSGETKGVHVGRAEVVARWRAGSNDLRPLVNPKIPEWRRANVLGAVVSAVRESCSSVPRSSSSSSASTSSSSSSTSATPPAISPASPLGVSVYASLSSPSSNSPFIVLPVARHRTGITLVVRKDSQALEELLAAPDAALSLILTPSSNSIPHAFENASVNVLKTSACAPSVNGKAFPSHASLPKSQSRSQDSN